MACRAPYRNPIHPIFPNRTYVQSDSQIVRSDSPYERVWVLQGGKAGCVWAPSSLVSAAALLKGQELMQLQLLLLLSFGSHGSLVVVGCVVQAAGAGAGCWACRWLSCERTDSNCPLPAQARLTTRPSTLPSPPSGTLRKSEGGSPLHARGSVAVLAGESGGTSTAIIRALATLFTPRGTRFIHSLLGPRSGSYAV